MLFRRGSRTSPAAALGIKGMLRNMQQQHLPQQLFTFRLLLAASTCQMQRACSLCLANSLGLKRSGSLLSPLLQRTLWLRLLALLLQRAA